jgi:hypothetical protein
VKKKKNGLNFKEFVVFLILLLFIFLFVLIGFVFLLSFSMFWNIYLIDNSFTHHLLIILFYQTIHSYISLLVFMLEKTENNYNFDIENGIIGVKRDAFLKLTRYMNYSDKKKLKTV